MTQFARLGIVLLGSLAAANCGGGSSPTAPTPTPTGSTATSTPSAPAPAPAAAPAPAPVSLTGTWHQSGTPWMTLALNGTTVTGTNLPQTIDLGGGLIALFSGTITGSASGASVNLSSQNTMTVRGFGDALTCRGGDTFTGQLSGNTLSGTFSSGTTPYICDGGIPLPTPQVSGPMIFTKQ